MNKQELWRRYQKYLYVHPSVGLILDVSHMKFPDRYLEEMAPLMRNAFEQMDALEKGSIANPDENRMVGHYWLRHPAMAPSKTIQSAIEKTLSKIKDFAENVHLGKILSSTGASFQKILLVGIGGSALGPQFIHQALGASENRMAFFCLDNTDPEGMDLLFSEIGPYLSETLVLVISKSGGTIETRNAMLEVEATYQRAGLDFAKHAVAITGSGSALAEKALTEGWLDIYPIWDWVGGRTSLFSAVGLLPASLEGVEIDCLLRGAANMDQITRQSDIRKNPSALLALMWFYAGEGTGNKEMVILPYKDRLSFLSRYLQQLIMESLGKEKNLLGETVHQGMTVYGNKGSTDQHAYVQQLKEGLPNFFVTFIQVLQERIPLLWREESGVRCRGEEEKGRLPVINLQVEPSITTGDFLHGFLLGTEDTLLANGRESMTITLNAVNATTMGALIALFERAVGLYASLIQINAYHQPGVEAGKKAAGTVLNLQVKILKFLQSHPGQYFTLQEITAAIDHPDECRTSFKILEYLTQNERGIHKNPGETYFEGTYGYEVKCLA